MSRMFRLRSWGRTRAARSGPGKQGPGGTGGWRWRGRTVRVWQGTEMGGGLSTGPERRRHRGRGGDQPKDEGRKDRPGTGRAWQQRNGRQSVRNSESADSDAAAVVLGIVIERVLSTRRQETGGRLGQRPVGNGVQMRPALTRTPPPRPHVKKCLAGDDSIADGRAARAQRSVGGLQRRRSCLRSRSLWRSTHGRPQCLRCSQDAARPSRSWGCGWSACPQFSWRCR